MMWRVLQGVKMCRQRVESIKCCFRFLDPWSEGEQIQNRVMTCCCVAAAARVPWSQDVGALRRRAAVSALFAMGWIGAEDGADAT